MTLLDLSAHRQNYVKDTAEDLQIIADMKTMNFIPEGTHEVEIVGINEKEGQKFKLGEKIGGTFGFSVIIRNSQKQEQMIYMSIPLAMTFLQAASNKTDSGAKYQFIRMVNNLKTMGIDPSLLRESIIFTNGASAEALIGTQFIIINSWNIKKLHLEYNSVAKAYFFVTAMGERFSSGEMALQVTLDNKISIPERYTECVAIAHQNGYQFSQQMDVEIEAHPTAKNDHINDALRKFLQPKEPKKPLIVNKTIPTSFPSHTVKKPTVPLDIEPDTEY